jgi:hypothetical protein
MKVIRTTLLACVCAAILCTACSSSNNLLLGRVEATVDGHTVVVTDCYRTSVPPPQQLANTADGKSVYRFMPCRDADVIIRGDTLTVNGKRYGRLNRGDAITVDHGKVLVNDHEVNETPSN